MKSQSNTALKQSDLINKLVLNRQTIEDMGRINQVWVDWSTYQLIGVTCTSGFWGRKKSALRWVDLDTVGEDSILATAQEVDLPDFEASDVIDCQLGHMIWTDAGNLVGSLVDYRFDPETGIITDCLFSSSGWRGVVDGVYILPTQAIISISAKRMLVNDATVREAELEQEGMGHKVSKAADFLKEDYAQTQRDLNALTQNTQATASTIQTTVQQFASEAKDKLPGAVTQAKDSVQELTRRFQPSNPESSSLAEPTPELTSTVNETQEDDLNRQGSNPQG